MDFDDFLNIDTVGKNQTFPTLIHYHRYEPTHYDDLLLLTDYLEPLVKRFDQLIDFGSGLMRVPIFINYKLNIETHGMELNKALYLQGLQNVRNYFEAFGHQPVSSLHVNALDYHFTGRETILFFFNPFSPQIFLAVINRFLTAYTYKHRTFVVLYYAKKEYIDVLQQFDLFEEIKRIELKDYHQDHNEMILIYKIG